MRKILHHRQLLEKGEECSGRSAERGQLFTGVASLTSHFADWHQHSIIRTFGKLGMRCMYEPYTRVKLPHTRVKLGKTLCSRVFLYAPLHANMRFTSENLLLQTAVTNLSIVIKLYCYFTCTSTNPMCHRRENNLVTSVVKFDLRQSTIPLLDSKKVKSLIEIMLCFFSIISPGIEPKAFVGQLKTLVWPNLWFKNALNPNLHRFCDKIHLVSVLLDIFHHY